MIRSLDLATSAIWIDRPYASAVNTFDFEPSQFPDPPSMIAAAHDNGLRMALWQHAVRRERPPSRCATRPSPTATSRRPPGCCSTAGASRSTSPTRRPTPGGRASSTATPTWASRASSSTTARTSCPASRGTQRVEVRRRQRRAHDALRLHAALPPGLRRDAAGGRRLPALPRRPLGRSAQRLRHLARRHGRDLHQARRAVRRSRRRRPYDRRRRPAGDGHHGAGLGAVGLSVLRRRHRRLPQQPAGQGAVHPLVRADRAVDRDAGRRQLQPDAVGVHARTTAATRRRSTCTASTRACTCGSSPTSGRTRRTSRTTAGRSSGRSAWRTRSSACTRPTSICSATTCSWRRWSTRGATTRHVIVPPGDWIDWWDGTVYSGGAAGGVDDRRAGAARPRCRSSCAPAAIVPLLRPTIDTLSPTTLPPDRVDSYANDAGVLYVRVVPGDSAQRVRPLRRHAHLASADRRRQRGRVSAAGRRSPRAPCWRSCACRSSRETVTRNDTELERLRHAGGARGGERRVVLGAGDRRNVVGQGARRRSQHVVVQ